VNLFAEFVFTELINRAEWTLIAAYNFIATYRRTPELRWLWKEGQ